MFENRKGVFDFKIIYDLKILIKNLTEKNNFDKKVFRKEWWKKCFVIETNHLVIQTSTNAFNPLVSMVHAVIWPGLSNVTAMLVGRDHCAT